MRVLNVVALTVLAAGCATSGGTQQGAAKVSDADLGKLQADQLGQVDQARQRVFRASDEQARAQLRLRDAQHEEQIAASDQGTAKAAMEQANTMQQIAAESRDATKLEQARLLIERAGAQQRAADARTDYAKKLTAASQASAQAASKQKALADAQLEVSKLEALRRAGVPTSGTYDMAALEKNVLQAQATRDSAEQKARNAQWWAEEAHHVYGDAQRGLQAQTTPTGTAPTGTGSSR